MSFSVFKMGLTLMSTFSLEWSFYSKTRIADNKNVRLLHAFFMPGTKFLHNYFIEYSSLYKEDTLPAIDKWPTSLAQSHLVSDHTSRPMKLPDSKASPSPQCYNTSWGPFKPKSVILSPFSTTSLWMVPRRLIQCVFHPLNLAYTPSLWAIICLEKIS